MFAKGFGSLGWNILYKHKVFVPSCCLKKGETGRLGLLMFWASSRGQVREPGNDQQLPRALERAEQWEAEALTISVKEDANIF